MSLLGDIAGQVLGNANPLLGVMKPLEALQGINPAMFPNILGVVTHHVQSAIQTQLGDNPVEGIGSLISEVKNGNLSALMPADQQQAMLNDIGEKAGVPVETLQQLLPALTPVVTQILEHTGQEGGLGALLGNVTDLFQGKSCDINS